MLWVDEMSSFDRDRNHWRTVRFGDVVRNVDVVERKPLENGLERFVGLEHLDPESLHIKRWGNIAGGTSFTRKFVKGQVLFGKRRAYQRKAAVAEFDGLCSSDILVFEPKDDQLLPELLPFIVQSEGFFQKALGTSAGSLSPRTKWKDLATYEFALPPKEEQRRMAEVLWAADETRERFILCKYLLDAIRIRFFGDLLRTNDGKKLKRVTLGDVCTIQSGQIDPRLLPYRDMIHIAPDDIETGTGRILEKKTAVEDNVQSGNYEFTARAILYSKIRPNLQKVAFPKFSGVCSADIYPVYAGPETVPDFLFWLLLSEDFTKYATAHSVRSAIPKLNRQAMLKYSFGLPTLDEQQRISNLVNSFWEADAAFLKHMTKTSNLKLVL